MKRTRSKKSRDTVPLNGASIFYRLPLICYSNVSLWKTTNPKSVTNFIFFYLCFWLGLKYYKFYPLFYNRRLRGIIFSLFFLFCMFFKVKFLHFLTLHSYSRKITKKNILKSLSLSTGQVILKNTIIRILFWCVSVNFVQCFLLQLVFFCSLCSTLDRKSKCTVCPMFLF